MSSDACLDKLFLEMLKTVKICTPRFYVSEIFFELSQS